MLSLDLSLRFSSSARRQATAWFVPGTAPQWLDEILRWDAPQSELRLYVVSGPNRGETLGALIVPPAASAVRPGGRGVPYGCVAGRLYLPVEAVLHPEVAAAELTLLLDDELCAYVFHPATGLVGFSPPDERRVSDLLQVPPPRPAAWDRAEAGLAINSRLVSIEPADPPSAAWVLAQAQGDIGTQAPRLDQLPPSPHEPSSGALSKMGRGLRRGLARAALWLTNKAPRTASHPTWVNALESWARSALERADSALSAMRNKELLRLLHLLENDPDQGLRYALPLAGDAHRGLSPPTAQLGPRDVDFDLRRLGGGHAADVWELSWEHHQRLRARYRELADREIRLGRHRRAAYIFAELLNDLQAAAATLVDGGHYREAAVLYRDRLQRPRDAARCLEQGGLLSEAIALYEQLGEFEKVAGIYERLDRRDEARAAYRQAADAHSAAGDYIRAAQLLEEKLESPRDALLMLDAAWPHATQAGRCLEASFDLQGRHALHEDARRRIGQLKEESVPPQQISVLAETLAAVTRSYPHEDVRRAAADACRVVAAERLPQAVGQERAQLVHAVRRLAPEDRLLDRDCFRLLRGSESAGRRAASAGRPTLLREFQLPQGVQWKHILAVGETLFAAGVREQELVLVRGDWTGFTQQPTRSPWPVGGALQHVLLACDPRGARRLHVHPLFGKPLSYLRVFLATDQFPHRVEAGPPPGCDESLWAMAQASNILWTARSSDSMSLDLAGYSESSALLTTRSVTLHRPLPKEPISLLPRYNALHLAISNELITLGPGDELQSEEFPSRICSLAASAPPRARFVATFEEGGLLMWGSYDRSRREVFGVQLSRPRVAFTRSGALVAADDSACEIYDARNRALRMLGSLPVRGGQLLSVLPTPYSRQFALCTADGRVRVYEVPP